MRKSASGAKASWAAAMSIALLTAAAVLNGCAWEWSSLFRPSPSQPRPRSASGYLSEQALTREGLGRPRPTDADKTSKPKIPAVPRLKPEDMSPHITIERTPPASVSTPAETEVITPAPDPGKSQRQTAPPPTLNMEDNATAKEPDGWELAAQWRCEAWGADFEVASCDAVPVGGIGKGLQARPIANAAKDKDKAVISLVAPGTGAWDKARQIVLDVYFPGEEALGLAVAVAIGNQRSYYESKCRRLRTGWNRNLVYSLDDAAWKSAGSRWEHSEAVPADEVVQIFLLLYPPPAQEAVVFDNIRIGYAAAAALP